jgi:hypothetical protein
MLVVTVLLFLGFISALTAVNQGAGGGGLTAPMWRRYALFGGAFDAEGWVLLLAAAVFISAALLLAACRKLYEPRTRALNYWQSLVFFALMTGCLMSLWDGDIKSERLCVWFWVGGGLVCSAAMILCSGRLSVGDELWRLKRIVSPLRRVDESIPWLAALSAVWVGLSIRFGLSGGLAIDRSVLLAAAIFMVAPALGLAVAQRLASLAWSGRSWALRVAPIGACVLWVVLPALIHASLYSPQAPGASLNAAAWVSPFYAIPLLVETPAKAAVGFTLSCWLALPGSAMTLMCLGVAIMGTPVALFRYWTWSKKVKYTNE